MVRRELFHAMLVHFPIALLVFSYVFIIIWRATGKEYIGQVSYWSLLVGAGAALAAAMSGFVAEDLAPHNEQAHEIMERFHQPLGLAVMSLSVALAVWGLLSRWKFSKVTAAAFIAVFTALIGLLAATGYYGGQMVYEHGMAVSTKELCSGHANHEENVKSMKPVKGSEKDEHSAGHDEGHGKESAGHDEGRDMDMKGGESGMGDMKDMEHKH